MTMDGTSSVLAAMTASIMKAKQGKGTTLTPVGPETAPVRVTILPDKAKASFPNDHPVESIRSALLTLRREVQHILEAIEAIEAVSGAVDPVPTAAEVTRTTEVLQAQSESEADARQREFDAALAAKAAAAQAAAWPKGWACPTHGGTTETRTSRKGRVYAACTQCQEFEHAN